MLLSTFIALLVCLSIPTYADFTVSDTMPACKGFTISNTGSDNKFGYAVEGGGDFNGDKIPDIVISTYEYPSPAAVYVIYGQKNGNSNIDVNSLQPAQGFQITGFMIDNFDNSNFLTLAGDLDGDGLADLVIGSSYPGDGYVIYGKKGGYNNFDITSLTSAMGAKITGAGGWNVNTRGDIDGDGLNDLIFGYSLTDSGDGAVFVIYGSPTRITDFDVSAIASNGGFKISAYGFAYIGAAVASVGDINGDGYGDFTFSAPGATPGGVTDSGIAYVIYGKSTRFSGFSVNTSPATGRFTVTGTTPSTIYKLCLVASDAADFNNDGYSDVLWASPPSNSDTGHVTLIYGANGGPSDFNIASMTASQGLTLIGDSSSDFFGSAMSSLKDLSGDGVSEILIGAKGYSSTGAVYLIYGRKDKPSILNPATLPDSESLKILGENSGDLFGNSVRDIGDINGDGIPDIAIGAPGTGTTGKVYVVYGRNAWACNTCDTFQKCKTCEPGYDYTWNGVCYKDGCPVQAPYKVGFECFSEEPKPPSVIQPTLKQTLTQSAITTYATNKVLNLWSPADALPFLYGQLKTSITYMRYLNVSRSDKLEELFQLYADSDSSIIPGVGLPESVTNAFPQYNLPYTFTKYEVPSSFLVNFGNDFICLGLIFVLFVFAQTSLIVIRKWMRNIPTVRFLLHKASTFLQNFFVGAFAESLGLIVFYATMEFKNSTTGETSFNVLSPLACYFCLAIGVTIMLLNVWIVRKFRGFKKKTSEEETNFDEKLLEKKYEGFAVLYDGFNNESAGQQLAFFLFNIRAVVEGFIVGVLLESPMAQTIFLMFLNLIFLLYVAIKRPFDSKLDTIQQFTLILLIFTSNCCLVRLASTDYSSLGKFESPIQSASAVIFYLLVIFQFIPLLFFAINTLLNLVEAYQFLRTHLSTKKKPLPKPDEKVHDTSSAPFNQVRYDTNSSQVPGNEGHSHKSMSHEQYNPAKIHPRKKRVIAPSESGFWNSQTQAADLENEGGGFGNHRIYQGKTDEPSRRRVRNEPWLGNNSPLNKSELPTFEMSSENPIIENTGRTRPHIEPMQVSVGQALWRSQLRRRRRNSTRIIYQ